MRSVFSQSGIKAPGAYNTAVGMQPANQGLGSGNNSVCEADFGLQENDKFRALKGLLQRPGDSQLILLA